MAFLGLRLGGGSSAGTVQNYSPRGCFGCGCGKGRNYGRFGSKFGVESPNSSLLQGKQRQESGKIFCKILPRFDRKLVIFRPKMVPKGDSGPTRGEDGSREAKDHFSQLIREVIFETLGHLSRCLFLMFFWKASFSPLARLLGAKGAEKGAEMEPKWRPKRVWGHPLGSVKSMAGAMFSAH